MRDSNLDLHLVTDMQLCHGRHLLEVLCAAVTGAVRGFQLREKDCTNQDFVELARAVAAELKPCRECFQRVIVLCRRQVAGGGDHLVNRLLTDTVRPSIFYSISETEPLGLSGVFKKITTAQTCAMTLNALGK